MSAAAAAAAASAASDDEGLTSTEWAGFCSACRGRGLIGGIVVWLRRRSAAKRDGRDAASGRPPCVTAAPAG